jgi:hypothetical protein
MGYEIIRRFTIAQGSFAILGIKKAGWRGGMAEAKNKVF